MPTSRSRAFLRPVLLGLATAAAMALGACGGGGGGGTSGTNPVSNPGPAPTTGTVGIMLTDGPADNFCQILATVERIDLLGTSGPTNVFMGPETVNVLDMRNYSDVFSIATDVPVGSYEKIRLTLSDLALVECNGAGEPEPAAQWEHPRLPGNGKLDLNPRGSFQVVGGETLIIELDLDMGKSLHVHQTGNGRWQFRPVVFVTITPDGSRLVRVFGQVRDLDGMRFELCPLEPASSTDDDDDDDGSNGNMDGDDNSGQCLDVYTDGSTGIFGANGTPAGLSTVQNGDLLTAIGFLSRQDDDDDDDSYRDDLRLNAAVLELGPQGTFLRTAGAVVSAPGNNSIFVFDPTGDATSPIDVLLQSGTRIFAIGSNEVLTSAALQPDTTGEVDGVFTDPAVAGEPLKSSLIVLEQGATAPPLLLNDRTVASKTAAIPATVPPSGRIDLQPATPPVVLNCVTTTATTRFLLITESASTSETAEIDFDALAAGDIVDVFGSADPMDTTCVLADTVQKYVAAP
jgi:Domain of unknown function (DUF4382)